MKKFALAVSLIAGLALQSASYAGLNYNYPISVSQYGANGQVRAARNSAGDQEFLGCAVFGSTQGSYSTYVACSARDAAGHSFYCSKYGASYQLVQAALAISSTSSIIVNADTSYNCTYIYVQNSSVNL